MDISYKSLINKIVSSKLVVKILSSKKSSSKIFMITSGVLLLLTFILPLWKIQLEAPQYPDPLGMYIYIYKIADDAPFDIKNINLLNHYVGMKEIPEHMKEFEIFPIVIVAMSIFGILAGLVGNHRLFLAWLIVMVLLSTAGLIDFYIWEYDYGHTLKPDAILKFTNPDGTPMGFQPPVLGSKHILNFVAHSYPSYGAFALFLSLGSAVLAFLLGSAGFKEKSASR